MKQLTTTSRMAGAIGLKTGLCILTLFSSYCLNAQTRPIATSKPMVAQAKTTTTPATTATAPVTTIKPAVAGPLVKNMKDYVKTAKGQDRAKKHAKATSTVLKKHIAYGDGTGATVTMVKNPSFDQGTTSKNPTKKVHKNDSTAQGGAKWVCSTENIELDASSTSFLTNDYSAAISHIYPGAIYTFDAIMSGDYKETTGPRYPITISTDNPNIKGTGMVVVADPNMATVRAGVAQLFRESTGPAATESQAFQVFQDYNSAATSLSIYGYASYAGASASNSYSSTNTSNSITITIDERKSVFTINTVPPDSGFFKNPATEDEPTLMVVGSVSYGIRVLANLTVTFSSSQEEDDFKAAYSGFGADANAAVHYLSSSKSVQSTINCYVVGGPGNSTLSFDKKDLENQLTKLVAGVNYQNARPISYQFYDMACNVVGAQSATDQFQERSCVPASTAKAKLKSVTVSWTNRSGKRGDDHFHFFLYANDISSESNGPQTPDNWNGNNRGNSENPPTDACLYYYYTYAVNTDYIMGQNTTIQAVLSPSLKDIYKEGITLGYLKDHGGLIHFHIFPNGSDSWTLSGLIVTLNFEDGVTEPIKWPGGASLTLSDNSTEGTLYFDGSFNGK
jgi:hypothetical protein